MELLVYSASLQNIGVYMFYIITIGFFLLTLAGIIYFLKQKRVPHGAQVKEYGYEINKFKLTNYGECSYAQWLHPIVHSFASNYHGRK